MKFYCGLVTVFLIALTGCDPRVGSEQWCDATVEKPNGDWTDPETRTFAKHCLYE